MALVRHTDFFDHFFGSNPFDPFENLAVFDRRPFSAAPRDTSAVASTRVDWIETPEAHIFRADLPGLKKDEVTIQVTDDHRLSISGERVKEQVDEKDNYRRVERSYGKFYREFKLPENTKTDQTCAKMENGVLTVSVPKSEPTKDGPQVRTIEIAS